MCHVRKNENGGISWLTMPTCRLHSFRPPHSQNHTPPRPLPLPQLWLLAEWVCSEVGRPVRKPLGSELVRLVDASITSSVRWVLDAGR